MILARGLGERLWPLIAFRPKPRLPAANRPLLYFPLVELKQQGFQQVEIRAGAQKGDFRITPSADRASGVAYPGDGGSGASSGKRWRGHVVGGQGRFVAFPGLVSAFGATSRGGALATLALVRGQDPQRMGYVRCVGSWTKHSTPLRAIWLTPGSTFLRKGRWRAACRIPLSTSVGRLCPRCAVAARYTAAFCTDNGATRAWWPST